MDRPEPITVSQLNRYVKNLIDNDEMLEMVYIRGEISNFKNHYTGHMYFTLKDESSLIKCVMFKTYTSNLNFVPKDGMSVVILGSVSVFERDGVYQIYVKGMEIDGIGALYAEYEKLKAKLEAEGLFDEKNKKKIPLLPKSIGIATSKTGAVIRDIINVTTRRFPNVNLKLFPSAVQGKGAAETIVKAIKYFNEVKNVDVIIIARGGGSLEDLWPFNEEITARAIYESEIPVISAVGHETDYTIADFVADLRAPTPSAAGELAVPEMKELRWKLSENRRKLSLLLGKRLEIAKNKYHHLKDSKVLRDPYWIVKDRILTVQGLEKELANTLYLNIKDNKIRLVKAISMLDTLSPLKTLKRGYSIIEKKEHDGEKHIINSVKDLNSGDLISIVLEDGKKEAKIV
ncbi:MAG: exodeoxyribonuclease VII large subunit [Clostridia bacterium]|nr:exodeoxyribonuclease VII large subunit [Clostridia bacterium]